MLAGGQYFSFFSSNLRSRKKLRLQNWIPLQRNILETNETMIENNEMDDRDFDEDIIIIVDLPFEMTIKMNLRIFGQI